MRRALHEAVAGLAKCELPAGRWTDLLPFLKRHATNDNAAQAAAALGMCAALAEMAPSQLGRHLTDVHPALARGLGSSDRELRRTSLETSAAFIGAPCASSCTCVVSNGTCRYVSMLH